MMLARAKTNLFLEVQVKRPDGFHELDTVYVELDLADTVEARSADRLTLEVLGDTAVSTGPENLMWRAADALRREAGRPDLCAALQVEKAIPAGGGLGGGSSDAAATLRVLDDTWNLNTPPERLHAIAAELGSDVPFFLRGGLQRGRGRGELLQPLPPLRAPLHLVLVFPEFGCPTPTIYGALAPFLPANPRSPEGLLAALASGDLGAVAKTMFNRLESSAESCFPQLRSMKQDLLARPGVLACVLSGSGSTLVCLTAAAPEAEALADLLQSSGRRALATRTAAPR